MKKATMMALVIAVMSGMLSACNTMEGLGQDIKNAGNSLEGSAQRHK